MKINNPDSPSVEKINSLIGHISESDKNRIEGIYLDESLMEFFHLENDILIPAVPVSELDYTTGFVIIKNLLEVIPEYLFKHILLEKRKPSSDQHSLHLVKKIQGRLIDFVHILKFDFKLSGGTARITDKGSSQAFPQYNTDRIRYKSRLVPVVKGSDPALIESLRLKSQLEVDTDGKRFTSVFFDEYSTAEISIDFSVKTGSDIFSIPQKLYQFISYDYFTACMNIPDPSVSNLERAAEIFEPLFFYLYFQYRERGHEIEEKQLSVCDEYLDCTVPGVGQKPLLKDSLKQFFKRYTLYTDDELLLKGLRKILVNG